MVIYTVIKSLPAQLLCNDFGCLPTIIVWSGRLINHDTPIACQFQSLLVILSEFFGIICLRHWHASMVVWPLAIFIGPHKNQNVRQPTMLAGQRRN